MFIMFTIKFPHSNKLDDIIPQFLQRDLASMEWNPTLPYTLNTMIRYVVYIYVYAIGLLLVNWWLRMMEHAMGMVDAADTRNITTL